MIKLFSDTETRPSEGMRKAMYLAEVGDEQKNEDPTVNALLDRVKKLLGKEGALFLPSGTMCNLIAIKTHTKHGDVVYADRLGHIIRAESGGMGMVSGNMLQIVDGKDGVFGEKELYSAMHEYDAAPYPYAPPSALVCVEQTHNFSGGNVWKIDELKEVYNYSHSRGCKVHMDGARVANAAASLGVEIAEIGKVVDTIWIDFSKGLGCPFGAVLAGNEEFIERARFFKHAFGGAMRQAGIMAAACLYALDNNLSKVGLDNEKAQKFASEIGKIKGVTLKHKNPPSNIVLFSVNGGGIQNDSFAETLKENGVETCIVGDWIRAVTHLDVSFDEVTSAARLVEKLVVAKK